MIKDDAKSGVLTPAELQMLQRIFDTVRHEQALDRDSSEASDLAVRLLRLYRNGIRDAKILQSGIAAHKN